MGKIVTGISGFCVALGVTTLHQQGVHGQFLIKKRHYWPKHVPEDFIDQYMMAKLLGMTETFVQELGGLSFFIHCTCDADYVTKIMSMHGVLEEIKIIRPDASLMGNGIHLSTPSHSAVTTIMGRIGSTMSTIVDMTLSDWRKRGGRNGDPTNNSLSCYRWRR